MQWNSEICYTTLHLKANSQCAWVESQMENRFSSFSLQRPHACISCHISILGDTTAIVSCIFSHKDKSLLRTTESHEQKMFMKVQLHNWCLCRQLEERVAGIAHVPHFVLCPRP